MNKGRNKWMFFEVLWLAACLLMLTAKVEAHLDLNPLNLEHNRPSHLVSTVGLQGCLDAVATVSSINRDVANFIGLTAQNCRNAAASTSQTLQNTEDGVIQTGQTVLNCVSDPLSCAQDIADNLGLTDPNLGKMAILTGNITFETGGLLFSDFGLTTINISSIDDTKVSDACKAFIALWDRTLEDHYDLFTVTTGGPYRIVVPACGSITYTLKPTNSLFTWNPPTHKVTVGAGNVVYSSGENSEAETIGVGTLQQQQTETTGEFSGQVTQEQQNTGKSSDSGAQEQEQQQNNRNQQQINASTYKAEQQEEESTQEKNNNQQILRIERKK